MNNNNAKNLPENNHPKRKSESFWDLILTGGWSSFNNIKSFRL